MFCILLGSANLVKSASLYCNFTSQVDYACSCDLYGCFASQVDGNSVTFDSSSGDHDAGKTANDVKHLGLRYSKFTVMPQRLDRLFNLTSLLIQWSEMTRLVKDDFIGLEHLEYLHLSNNLIKVLPSDVFSRLPHLKKLTIRSNEIEELPRNIFQFNVDLDGIWMEQNRIKYVNPTIFNNLPKLYYAEFVGENHTCLTKYYKGNIDELKEDVKKCANPKDEDEDTTTIKTIEY